MLGKVTLKRELEKVAEDVKQEGVCECLLFRLYGSAGIWQSLSCVCPYSLLHDSVFVYFTLLSSLFILFLFTFISYIIFI